MTRFFRSALPFLLGLLVSVTACKKGESDVVPNPDTGNPGTPTAAFVGIRWQMASFELDPPMDLDGDGDIDKDLLVFLRPCDRDDTVKFEKGGAMSGDSGALRCDDEPAPGKPGTWTYNEATKKLKIIDGDDGTASEWTVLEATTKVLKVKATMVEDGQSLTTIITWKAV
ncbi:hypothetical protein FAES_4654 [Fibrella aestuarina BUZ 2]|uniref:Lipocalin-like domain-containing protein n=1 Tax=Fibrella aestuarina BUZ 2 TaxID=1166018 RepID=I0KEV0_9BACT|nr:hypothetical protein [Fibrella aestuarina]CCH02653.1 hypothetical protein FAES_4654 [Fibrella aestuarina BUZ 2]